MLPAAVALKVNRILVDICPSVYMSRALLQRASRIKNELRNQERPRSTCNVRRCRRLSIRFNSIR